MKLRFLLSFIIGIFFILACEKSFQPIVSFNDVDDFRFSDTTIAHFPGDIDIVLDTLPTYYTLDDEIVINSYLINRSAENVSIYFLSYPPYDFGIIYNQFGKSVFVNGLGGLGEGDRTLLPGDSLAGGMIWQQTKNDTSLIFSELKTYSGWYKVVNYFTGSTDMGHLANYPVVKWIKITEEGDPLAYHCVRDWNKPDTLKSDFAIRNRISQVLNYKYADSNPISVTLFNDTDTVFVKYFDTDNENLTLEPFSDLSLFSFQIPKDDSTLTNLDGYYTLRTQIRLKERTLEGDCFFFF